MPSNASMVPSRSSYATASGSSAPAASGAKIQFRPVIPQRRKPSESPAPQTAADPSQISSSPAISGGSSREGGSARGRGGARPPRQSAQMTASGPFSLGPSSRPSASRARVTPLGPGGSGPGPAAAAGGDASASKAEADRASYRNPDKIKDAEEYSDPEDGGVAIIDMDQVYCLDDLAPIALPRVAEKSTKKDRVQAASERQRKMDGRVKLELSKSEEIQVKPESDCDVEPMDDTEIIDASRAATVSSQAATPQPETGATETKLNPADALDLSESEGEELMDDLVDDFVFNEDEDLHRVAPEKRLYLFQFPQLFPSFKVTQPTEHEEQPFPANETASSKRRTVSFAEGTAGGAGSTRPVEVKDESADEADGPGLQHLDGGDSTDDDQKAKAQRSPHKVEGKIGKLDVYRDGRVFFRFGELVMEVTGGSQSTFLQQIMLLNRKGGTATALGELHRKFIVTPELDCMLDDISMHDDEQRLHTQKVKRENEERDLAEKLQKFGNVAGAYGTRQSSVTDDVR